MAPTLVPEPPESESGFDDVVLLLVADDVVEVESVVVELESVDTVVLVTSPVAVLKTVLTAAVLPQLRYV
jgi:hypothetical protein